MHKASGDANFQKIDDFSVFVEIAQNSKICSKSVDFPFDLCYYKGAENEGYLKYKRESESDVRLMLLLLRSEKSLKAVGMQNKQTINMTKICNFSTSRALRKNLQRE